MVPNRMWLSKFLESILSTLPIFAVVLVLYLLEKFNVGMFANIDPNSKIDDLQFLYFSICALLIALGLGQFTIGADQSMSQIGEYVGGSLMKKRNLFLIISMTLILGIFITIAEPDLTVLAEQLGEELRVVILISVGVGVGIFLVVGVLRVIFGLNLNIMFIAFYGLVFTLAYFIDPRLLPVCFDSGGVTTGPVTVPFILAFGLGLASSSRRGKKSGDDSFGLTALCSIGPILAVMLVSQFVDESILEAPYNEAAADMGAGFWTENFLPTLVTQLGDVAIAVAPITVFFLIYNFIFLKLPLKKILQILVGLVYAYIGLVALLTAVNAGFKPIAQIAGQSLGSNPQFVFIALIFGALFGMFGVFAEPAVHVLAKQIEEVSEGSIKANLVLALLAVAIGGAVVLALIRSYFQFDVMYYLVPGYIIALCLTFMVPKIYTAMAFDSGGVASGPMTSTFVLPFVIGFAYSRVGYLSEDGAAPTNGEVYRNGFGTVALVAMMPLIVLQLLGLYVSLKTKILYKRARARIVEENDDQIIHFGEEASA